MVSCLDHRTPAAKVPCFCQRRMPFSLPVVAGRVLQGISIYQYQTARRGKKEAEPTSSVAEEIMIRNSGRCF
jgi:hypothetical protein